MEHIYNLRVNMFKYRSIHAKIEPNDREKAKEAAKINLKMMIQIACEEVLSKKPTSREFRLWLIWNETMIQYYGKMLGLAICTDFRHDLPKCPRNPFFSWSTCSSTTADNAQNFQTLLNEFEHAFNILQEKTNRKSLYKHTTGLFCSLLSKLSQELYEQYKNKLANYYEYMFKTVTQQHENEFAKQLKETYKLCRRTFETNLVNDTNDLDDKFDIYNVTLRKAQAIAVEQELKRMYTKKVTDQWNDIANKTGPVYEKCETRLKTLKNQYLNLSVLFSKDSLSLNGIKYIKKKWTITR
ncbi:unnamed protein product [Adineta steineri]|uniref:Uncharacterized protein n=1 Tax=Adineta steineri TaxID=433720 RepID=A0A814KJU7_9BILA|nr:unnamed protein product [Adineta steineri]